MIKGDDPTTRYASVEARDGVCEVDGYSCDITVQKVQGKPSSSVLEKLHLFKETYAGYEEPDLGEGEKTEAADGSNADDEDEL